MRMIFWSFFFPSLCLPRLALPRSLSVCRHSFQPSTFSVLLCLSCVFPSLSFRSHFQLFEILLVNVFRNLDELTPSEIVFLAGTLHGLRRSLLSSTPRPRLFIPNSPSSSSYSFPGEDLNLGRHAEDPPFSPGAARATLQSSRPPSGSEEEKDDAKRHEAYVHQGSQGHRRLDARGVSTDPREKRAPSSEERSLHRTLHHRLRELHSLQAQLFDLFLRKQHALSPAAFCQGIFIFSKVHTLTYIDMYGHSDYVQTSPACVSSEHLGDLVISRACLLKQELST